MTTTTNLGLRKPGASDKVSVDDLNFNADKVDAAIAGLKPTMVTVSLPASGWVEKAQTVAVEGVTAAAAVIAAGGTDSFVAYTTAGVHCTAQGDGTLTFACVTVPTADVTANVFIVK